MRYADYAYKHISNREDDSKRQSVIDRKAKDAGYKNSPDYIDNVQARESTKYFHATNGRTVWMNKEEKLLGWNNSKEPESSTVIPARKCDKEFENHKHKERGQERTGGIPEHERQVHLEKQKEVENLKQEGKNIENQGDKKQNQQEEQKVAEKAEQPKQEASLWDLRKQAQEKLKEEGKEYKPQQEKQISQEQQQDKSRSR